MKNEQNYAVISTGGKQYKVSEGDKLAVELLESEVGKKVTFEDVLLVSQDGKVSVGNPTVANAKVSATLEDKFRDEKVLVFKKKRRKGYQKKTGHRQNYHMLTIDDISLGGKSASSKKSAAKEEKADEKKDEKKAAAKSAPKKETAKKAAPKKSAKAPAKKAAKPKAKAEKKAEAEDKE